MGRPKNREYKATFTFSYRYEKTFMPPLTPAMKLLGFLFKEKAIGGRVGKPVGFIEDIGSATVTEKIKNITIDALIPEEFRNSEREKLGDHEGVNVPIPSNSANNIQRNEMAYFCKYDYYKRIEKVESVCKYCESFHKIIPLLHSAETRAICIENLKYEPKASNIYKFWNDGVFDIEIYDAIDIDRAYNKISSEINIDKSACRKMIYLAQEYRTYNRISRNDYHLIMDYYINIHKIMYLLSTSTLILEFEPDKNRDITLNFFEPQYKKLIKNNYYFKKELRLCNEWLSKKAKIPGGFEIYADSEKTFGVFPMSFVPSNKENPYEFILKKLLMLVLSVYQSDLLDEYMSVGRRYISVCHYCGGLFFREDPKKRFCNYYDDKTPCNNKGLYKRTR